MSAETAQKREEKERMTGMRIDVPASVAQRLTRIAAEDQRSRRKYLEKLIKDHVNNSPIQ